MVGAPRRAKQIMKTQPFTLLLWLAAAWVVSIPGITTASPELDLARQLNHAFIEVAEKASSAVVVVNVVEKPGASDPDWLENETDASPHHKQRPQKSEKMFT